MSNLPSGTVTFLFTDIEGSTKLARDIPTALPAALARHHAILRESIESRHGHIFQIVGDAFCAAFHQAADGLDAALAAQRTLHAEAWGDAAIRVRMGLHTGDAEARDGAYHGYLTLSRAQRLMSAASGGQLLVSSQSEALVRDRLPASTALRDLGEVQLKDFPRAEHVYQLVAPGLPADFPPLKSLSSVPNNLPLQLTSFIGREQEIVDVKRLLATTRLLTLAGSGGTGKTRLSLEVASELLGQFSDGVWFVELAPLSDPAFVPQATGSALSLPEQSGRPILATLLEHLRDKHLLLILDNCEHLIEACADFADTLLHAVPKLKIMASSREALGIAGESVYRVPSLRVPEPEQVAEGQGQVLHLRQFTAVQLFVERAASVKTAFVLSGANAPAVAQICYQLDGIPLAIELAAARINVFSAEQIAARLTDRFRLLTGGSRTAFPRQQTLRGAVDWSYGLLSEPERVVLCRLSVFAGGWSYEAAEAVCEGERIAVDALLDLLTRLVEKSLVVQTEREGEARFQMLETIRQYAHEKLVVAGEVPRIRMRHLEYYLGVANAFENEYRWLNQVKWLEKLELEHDNVRVALEWSLESHRALSGLRLTVALEWFWFQRHNHEGLGHCRKFLSRLEAADRSTERAMALTCEGFLLSFQSDTSTGQKSLEEALAIARERNDEGLIARSLVYLGLVAEADRPAARMYLMEGLEVSRGAELSWETGIALWLLGDLVLSENNLNEAEALFDEFVRVRKPTGEKIFYAVAPRRLGQIALRRGDLVRAAALVRESMLLNLEGDDKRGIAACMATLGAVMAAGGRLISAARTFASVDLVFKQIHTRPPWFDHQEYERSLESVRSQLSAQEFTKAWAEGRALTMKQAIALALEETDG